MRRLGRFASLPLVLAMLGATAAANTLVVAMPGDPLGDYASLQSAVFAAADGDTILVRPGSYTGLTLLLPKRLTIVGAGVPLTAIESLRTGVFAGSAAKIVLRGLIIRSHVELGPAPAAYAPLHLDGFAANVLVEECELIASRGWPAAYLDPATNVTFVRSTLRGSPGFSAGAGIGGAGGPGLHVVGSPGSPATAFLHDCTVVGGAGTTSLGGVPGDGGEGIVMRDAVVRAFASHFTGGDASGAGVAGTGAHVLANALLVHQGCAFTAGSGSPPVPPIVLVDNGADQALAGTPALLTTSGKTEVGQSAVVVVEGTPGASALLLLGTPFPLQLVGGVAAPLGLAPPFVSIDLGSVPPAGSIAFAATVPPLPSGLESASIGLQALIVPGSPGPAAFSNLSMFTAVLPGL